MKLLFILLSLLSFSSFGYPQQTNSKEIRVGPGPEDFAIDTLGAERLLISCTERRGGNNSGNGIWAYDFKTGNTKKLHLTLKTERDFNPHGIYLIYENGGKYLFVINHISKKQNEIVRFRVLTNSIVEEKNFRDKLIKHPNDIFATDKNEFYFTNDRPFCGSITKYYQGEYSTIAKSLSYPNGIQGLNDTLYVSTVISNKVFQVYQKGSGYKRKKMLKIKGGDNFSVNGRNNLLLTSHPKLIKFVKHARNPEKKSPSQIFDINTQTGEKRLIFSSEGEDISAVSVAVEYKGFLYLGQVFDGFILKVAIK
ncbi:MAG: hypothetical protein DRJ05_13325 [Bacteroidetes bacterium]|nr:MAG: hypothetical protein DRJ05_13325 [Bacteroidota bacterium]